jgi:hypothetical protein
VPSEWFERFFAKSYRGGQDCAIVRTPCSQPLSSWWHTLKCSPLPPWHPWWLLLYVIPGTSLLAQSLSCGGPQELLLFPPLHLQWASFPPLSTKDCLVRGACCSDLPGQFFISFTGGLWRKNWAYPTWPLPLPWKPTFQPSVFYHLLSAMAERWKKKADYCPTGQVSGDSGLSNSEGGIWTHLDTDLEHSHRSSAPVQTLISNPHQLNPGFISQLVLSWVGKRI